MKRMKEVRYEKIKERQKERKKVAESCRYERNNSR
jgi:hypothetical protein